VRLKSPSRWARIARFLRTCVKLDRFKSGRFKSEQGDSRKVETRSFSYLIVVRSAIFLFFTVIPFPNPADAQSVFHFSKEVHWGDAVLPPGDYVITSLDIKNAGAVLTVAPPNSQPRPLNSGAEMGAPQEFVSGESSSPLDGFFTIHNPHNQTLSYPEAETIYLSACRVVEQQFSRADPVRPRLSLLLGSENDRVYYPKREIQLRKWDKYKFAEGVVILAVDSLLPADAKLSLSKVAVSEAETMVDVRELKINRNSLRAAPRN
jgi:hypothetical protein